MERKILVLLIILCLAGIVYAFDMNSSEWKDCEQLDDGSKICRANLPSENMESCSVSADGYVGSCVSKPSTGTEYIKTTIKIIPEKPNPTDDIAIEITVPKHVCGESLEFLEPKVENLTITFGYYQIVQSAPSCHPCTERGTEAVTKKFNMGKLPAVHYTVRLLNYIKLDNCDGTESQLTYLPQIHSDEPVAFQEVAREEFSVYDRTNKWPLFDATAPRTNSPNASATNSKDAITDMETIKKILAGTVAQTSPEAKSDGLSADSQSVTENFKEKTETQSLQPSASKQLQTPQTDGLDSSQKPNTVDSIKSLIDSFFGFISSFFG